MTRLFRFYFIFFQFVRARCRAYLDNLVARSGTVSTVNVIGIIHLGRWGAWCRRRDWMTSNDVRTLHSERSHEALISVVLIVCSRDNRRIHTAFERISTLSSRLKNIIFCSFAGITIHLLFTRMKVNQHQMSITDTFETWNSSKTKSDDDH